MVDNILVTMVDAPAGRQGLCKQDEQRMAAVEDVYQCCKLEPRSPEHSKETTERPDA